MRKLFCLLSTVLLLFGCNDVDEFGLMLPDSVTLDEVRPISELTYEELNSLVDDVYLREEMRRNGGLLVQARANTASSHQGYDYLEVYCSDAESMLPSQTDDYWNSMLDVGISEFGGGKYYVSWGYDALQELPGTTIYCEASASLYGEQMPGFVDEIRNDYSYNYVFSDIRSYTYPDAPVITEFNVNGGLAIMANFNVVVEGNDMPERGICCSTSNPLPNLNDEVTYVSADYDYNTYADVLAMVSDGTYNVRAFAIGSTGEVSYSPVQRVSCQGLMASVQIDSIVNVADIPYNSLANYLPAGREYYLDDLRTLGGTLIYSSAILESGIDLGWDMGLSVSVTGTDFPTHGYNETYGINVLRKEQVDANHFEMLHWQQASNYNSYNHNGFYYQAAVGTSSIPGYSIWSYSDTVSAVWDDEPLIEAVSYAEAAHQQQRVSINLTSWDYEAQVGICYSTMNDLPTLEQCDGVAPYSGTVLDSQHIIYEFTLPAGTYYVRAYARSEGGLTYAPVQQVTVTEDMTTR